MATNLWDAKANEVSAQDYAAIEAEERLVYEAQKAVRALLKRKEIKAADLARLLGVSEARVSQMLGGEARNLTLRTLARIYHVLGSRCRVAEAEGEAAQVEPEPRAEAAQTALPADPDPTETGKIGRGAGIADWGGAELGVRLLGERAIRLAELSDEAAFGSEAVWIFGAGVKPANENDRVRDDRTARGWMSAPLHYEEYERQYA